MIYKPGMTSSDLEQQKPKATKKTKSPRKKLKKPSKKLIILLIAFVLSTVLALGLLFGRQTINYFEAKDSLSNGNYMSAIELFSSNPDFFDTTEQIELSYYLWTLDLIEKKSFSAAASNLNFILNPEHVDEVTELLYRGAKELFETGKYTEAASLLSDKLSHFPDEDNIYMDSIYELGKLELEQGFYSNAYGYLATIDPTFRDTADLITSAQTAVYDRLVEQYEASDIVPEGFDAEMLNGFLDANKFVLLRTLQQASWSTDENISANLEIIYQLEGFLDITETEYIFFRLLDKRFSGGGYYFEIDSETTRGKPVYNVPGYSFSGYYGLYEKFEENIMYIGSSERVWTKQFRFYLSEKDTVLSIYSYMTNSYYTLYFEKNI